MRVVHCVLADEYVNQERRGRAGHRPHLDLGSRFLTGRERAQVLADLPDSFAVFHSPPAFTYSTRSASHFSAAALAAFLVWYSSSVTTIKSSSMRTTPS